MRLGTTQELNARATLAILGGALMLQSVDERDELLPGVEQGVLSGTLLGVVARVGQSTLLEHLIDELVNVMLRDIVKETVVVGEAGANDVHNKLTSIANTRFGTEMQTAVVHRPELLAGIHAAAHTQQIARIRRKMCAQTNHAFGSNVQHRTRFGE
jgi:hypothetical protein